MSRFPRHLSRLLSALVIFIYMKPNESNSQSQSVAARMVDNMHDGMRWCGETVTRATFSPSFG